MILAVDHIACSPADPEGFVGECVHCGYQMVVSEAGLVNLDIKRALLSRHEPKHDLTLMRSIDDVAIEVLDHGSSSGRTGYLARVAKCHFSCRTTDVDGSRSFWGRLGFLPADGVMSFQSAFQSSPLMLTLCKTHNAALPLLDDIGFNAVAMLSSSAAHDREALADDLCVTELRRLHVGGRDLELFFARNPKGGEIVEVFGLATRR